MSPLSKDKEPQPQNPRRPKREDETPEREEGLDRTLEESFPASDPPSSIPNPEDDEDAA